MLRKCEEDEDEVVDDADVCPGTVPNIGFIMTFDCGES